MNSYEAVKKAIKMEGPDYVPVMLFRTDMERSDIVTVDIEKFALHNDTANKHYKLNPLTNEVLDIFNAGGIFNYARKMKIIK